MKIKLSFIALLAVLAVGGVALAQSQNESLGDYARAVKKVKPASSSQSPKVFDNDNLPAEGSVSVVGTPTPADSDAGKDQAASNSAEKSSADAQKIDANSDKKDQPQLKPGQPTEQRDAALEAVKKRLDEQKQKVDLLSRELDVLTKEHNLKVATYYQDPNHMADPNSLFEEQSKYKEQLDEKQKALDKAKTELSDMQDDARRNGAPNSMLE